jgi:hypothetical protein
MSASWSHVLVHWHPPQMMARSNSGQLISTCRVNLQAHFPNGACIIWVCIMDVLLVLPTVTVLNAWYSLITDQTTKFTVKHEPSSSWWPMHHHHDIEFRSLQRRLRRTKLIGSRFFRMPRVTGKWSSKSHLQTPHKVAEQRHGEWAAVNVFSTHGSDLHNNSPLHWLTFTSHGCRLH